MIEKNGMNGNGSVELVETDNDDSSSELSIKILSDITVFNKYAKYIPEKGRRESWEEICVRNMNMHIKKYPELKEEIEKVYEEYVITKKVLPSMRALQFSGKPIELANNRIYNCAAVAVDDYRVFSEIMLGLLGGSGIGFSVQHCHINKLPPIKKPIKSRRYVISDDIQGWADSIKALVGSYLANKPFPKFDYSDIRPKGAMLITSGGKSPGYEPLKECHFNMQKILDRKKDNEQLTSLEIHDLICTIADAVLSGGIRRAALISVFDMDDEDMLTCKFGNWWELEPQRSRANNSVMILRHRVKEKDFKKLWEKIKASGSGEPGFIFSNNSDWIYNPCCEISLRCINPQGGGQFCNLTTFNISNVYTQEELNNRSKAASFIGTLQAGYTDFHYLREGWKKNTEKDALLGVSQTGIASGTFKNLNLEEAVEIIIEENKRVAKIIGIKSAARYTCVKPEGTGSLVLGTSSGIHSWFAPYYIRRIKLGKNEALYKYLMRHIPELIEEDFFKPKLDAFITIPIKAPKNAIVAGEETALQLLERVKHYSTNWVKPGHIRGDNSHNVSATIYIKNNEWSEVGKWLWENREFYNGLSVLPYTENTYKQAPFEEITKEKYEQMINHIKKLDLTKVKEENDKTDQQGELACAGGSCEIQY